MDETLVLIFRHWWKRCSCLGVNLYEDTELSLQRPSLGLALTDVLEASTGNRTQISDILALLEGNVLDSSIIIAVTIQGNAGQSSSEAAIIATATSSTTASMTLLEGSLTTVAPPGGLLLLGRTATTASLLPALPNTTSDDTPRKNVCGEEPSEPWRETAGSWQVPWKRRGSETGPDG